MSDDEEIKSPRLARTWADVFKYDQLEECSVERGLNFRDFGSSSTKDEDPTACCQHIKEGGSAAAAKWLTEMVPKMVQLDCIINTSRGLINFMIESFDSFTENERVNMLDSFIRMRHDTLSAKMSSYLKMNQGKTDVEFCTVFPIKSKRTPDFIAHNGDKYVIIEVTAVSNPERAYRKKGHQTRGYESKYNKELMELKDLGFDVTYVVVVFDVSDSENVDHAADINEALLLLGVSPDLQSLADIDYLRREFITQTKAMYDEYSQYLGILFGSQYSLKTHSDLTSVPIFGEPKKKFTGSYSRMGISNYIYEKVMSAVPRLTVMLSRTHNKSNAFTKFKLVFEQVSSNFHFKRDKSGSEVGEWLDNIDSKNYSWICTNMDVEMKGVKFSTPKADFEFMSYEKGNAQPKSRSTSLLKAYDSTHKSSEVQEERELQNFGKKIDNLVKLRLNCCYEDEGLENRIIASIMDMDAKVNDDDTFKKMSCSRVRKPLAFYKVDSLAFQRAIDGYNLKLAQENSTTGGVEILTHSKQSFIYPIAQLQQSDYIDFRKKPKILESLKNFSIGGFTDRVLNFARSDMFQFGSTAGKLNTEYDEVRMELSKYNKTILEDLKELYNSDRSKDFPKLKDLPNHALHHSRLSELNKKLNRVATESGVVNKNIGLVTTGRGKRSAASIEFKEEMSHFRSKSSKAHRKGVGMSYDYDNIKSLFESLKSALLSPSDAICPDQLYDETVSVDSKLLVQLKEEMVGNNKSYYEHLRSTYLYHSCAFISRLCHTLMFHSQTSINSTKVVVDNLGYDSVLLLVRGGKKVFKTKKSKLFRLVYPSFKAYGDLYTGSTLPTDFKSISIGGRSFIISPWMNFHETIMADGLTFLHRCMGFAMLNKTPHLSNDENMDRVFFNIILAIHNRRQTESMLHNLRYVFMNCLSEVSAIEEILPELAGFNYDYFQCWVRHSLLINFKPFAMKLNTMHESLDSDDVKSIKDIDLTHPFNGHPIRDHNTLALGIYSSYLMSKAPTTQLLEQAKNMRSIMKTHDEFVTGVGDMANSFVSLKEDFVGYYDKLSENDFNLDPSYCFLLGKFMGDYILNIEKKSKLIQKWDSILDKPWDEMANTKGLRGSNDDFFGNKGYYIVYKEVLKDVEGFESLMSTLSSDASSYEKEKVISETNESFKHRIATEPLDDVVFHVVDKVQRGGSREIYVMDLETKVHQQVIEEYTKHLCKLIPNEMISIPSNKRLSTIHSRVFEGSRADTNKYYWVLDCRKWAPKSVVEKFMVFLMGAKHALPDTFVVHCLNFFNMMLEKKVYTRPKVVELINGSRATSGFGKYFKFDEQRKAYYFDMKYSWVMGIFNYFSSLMHVANQMHASHIIRITSHLSFNSENLLHMVAHSDDSAGKITVGNRFEMLRASFIYETLMHSANHLLSKKKCNQGKLYYEFLSILYIGGNLLSLLSKFTGIFNYHPTDKGYCSDITDAYSKSTELLLNGATFEQSYIAMKIQSSLIYRFYFGNTLPKKYYEMPPAMFGVPDAHPLMALLCGSDADVFRIFKTCDQDTKRLIVAINSKIIPLGTETAGLLRSFQCTPKVSMSRKLQNLKCGVKIPDYLTDTWTMKKVKFDNTKLNAAQFVLKLSDKTFIAALQDETLTRRLSRSYYFRSHLTVHTSYGDMTPKEVRELIFLVKRAISGDTENLKDLYKTVVDDVKESEDFQVDCTMLEKVFEFLYCEISRLYDYMDKIHYNTSDVIENQKTCKPVYINIQKTVEESPINYSPQSLCSWIKEPSLRNILPDTRGYHTAGMFVEKSLSTFGIKIQDVNEDELCTILQKIKQKSRSEYFCYSNLPWDLREVSTYQDVLNFLSHNSFSGKMVRGIAIQFTKTMSLPIENLTFDLQTEDLQMTVTMLIMANAIMSSDKFDPEMLQVDMQSPAFLGGGVKTLKQIIIDINTYWGKQKTTTHFLQCLMVCVSEMLDGNRTFSAEKVCKTFFHCFIKRQFLVDNIWLGQGRLLISLSNTKIVLELSNMRISSITVQTMDEILTHSQIAYINLCLSSAQFPKLQESMNQTEVEDWGMLGLCYDQQGNYYIGDVQGSMRNIRSSFDLNLNTVLSAVENGRVKSFKGSKLSWESVVDGKSHSYQLSTLPVETQNVAVSLRGMLIDNIKNKRLLSEYDGDASSILLEICAKELDLERHINPEIMMKNYDFTDTYKVIKTCHIRSLCKVVNPEVKNSNIPAPDGGLINALIQYSKHDPSFDFKWQRRVSPEYMALKSSQPESFVTEVSDTLMSKYNSLYTDIDKQSIHLALTRLSGAKQGINLESEVMNLLCTWGHSGIAGALEELSGGRSLANFEKIRSYPPCAPYVSFFNELFMDIFIPLMNIYRDGLRMEGFSPIASFGCDVPVNPMNINYYIMDMVHNTVLCTYFVNARDKWCYDEPVHMLQAMVNSIILHPKTNEMFTKLIQSILITRNLPTDPKSIGNWRVAVTTTRDCYINCHKKGYDLDFNIRRDLSTSNENPYVITRDLLLKHGVKMKSLKIFHYGAISTHLYDLLSTNYRDCYKGSEIWFKVEMVTLKSLSETEVVSYNHLAFPHKKFVDGFTKTDAFDEISTEYQSNEPDCDYIESVLDQYVEDEEGQVYSSQGKKFVNLSLEGRLTKVLKVDLKIVFLGAGSLNLDSYSHLRMLANDVIIISNSLVVRFALNPCVLVFRSLNCAWSGHSILNPKNMYYYVISRDFDDEAFWAKSLNAEPVKRDKLNKLIGADYMTIRNSRGTLKNENEMLDSSKLWAVIDENMNRSEQEEKDEIQRKKEAEKRGGERLVIDSHARKMIDEGLEQDQVDKYLRLSGSGSELKGWDALLEALGGVSEQSKESVVSKEVVDAVASVVGSIKTATQHEMIMQAPMVFGGGKFRGNPKRNNLFRERKIIAELESLCPGLIWKVLSGSLFISQGTYNMFKDQIEMYKMMVRYSKQHKKGKQFIINLCMLILNDAVVIKNPIDDMETWKQLTSMSLKLMLLDENKVEDDDWDFQNEDHSAGSLRYGVSGARTDV